MNLLISNANGTGREPTRWKTVAKWLKLEAISFLVWGLLSIGYAFQQAHMDWVLQHRHTSVYQMLIIGLKNYEIIAFLTPFVIWITGKADFRRTRVLSSALIHVCGFFCFVAVQSSLRVGLFAVHDPTTFAVIPRSFSLMESMFWFFLNDDVFIYFPIVGMTIGYQYHRQSQDRELAESKLQAQLARAQLQILKMQLHPHFLFNTLHAISTLVGKDPKQAKKMIALLSDLLRMAIDYGSTQEVPLKEEVEFVAKYLEIENVRFQENLTTSFEIPPDTLSALVPNLLLQPLVENAVKHGVCALARGGRVEVSAEHRGGQLVLRVRDNGPGIPATARNGSNGLGLKITRARLEQLYGSNQSLRLENLSSGGLSVSIQIPFRTASPELEEAQA
ncbi:MAG: histidine kinase [Acidobacteriia bacterium]|nr:histidine kinase [Terriglobia bacterium]